MEESENSLEPLESKDAEKQSQTKQSQSFLANTATRDWTKLLLHASIMCGREFLYAVEIVLVTPIILQLGMPESYYSLMWCFSPTIGVLVGPILGSQSDRCTLKLGRRRPFIIGLVIGAIIGLTLLIFSKDLSEVFGGSDFESRRIWGVVIGIMGAQLMDFCLDQAETPLRAYTLDVCSPNDQQRAFALQTVFIGIGGALGFIVDGIDWEQTAISHYFGSQIKVVYIFAVFIYLSTMLCNLLSIKEIPWKKKSRTAIIVPSKSIVMSQIPKIHIESSVDTDSELSGNEREQSSLQAEENSCEPSSLVPMMQNAETEQDEFKEGRQLSRPVSMFGRISFSKGLYISSSCPGGLNEQTKPRTSFSSFGSDSAYEEDPHCSSSDDLNSDDVSLSMPTMTISQGKRGGLLNYIRSKEFNKKAKSSNSINELVNLDHRDTLLSLDKYEAAKKAPTEARVVVRELEHDSDLESPTPKHRNKTPHKRKRRKKKTAEGEPVSLRQLWMSVLTMPKQLRWLCVAQLLGFIGMEVILLWYTDLMGRVVYQGDPQAPVNSTERRNYNSGVKMGCWGLTVYSLAMIFFSAIMEKFRLLDKIQIRLVYSLSFLLVVVTTTVMFFLTKTEVILALSWCIGVTFSIMLTVPYVLVGKYHQMKQYVNKSPGGTKRGFGLDCAILACQMYIGNIFSSLISSPLIYLFGTVKAMLITTGACHLAAFVVAYFLVYYPEGKTNCENTEAGESVASTAKGVDV